MTNKEHNHNISSQDDDGVIGVVISDDYDYNCNNQNELLIFP